jgi:tungstate transport system ATP-binding protein
MADGAIPGGSRSSCPLLPLVVDGLCFVGNDRRPILDRVSLRLEHGFQTVVLGPNGAGKSVLLRLCHGLLQPTAGSITWGGLSPSAVAARQGMVFQRPVLLRRSVRDNINHVLAIKGVRRPERGQKVQAALERAGLAQLADRPARTLSGGEQQRLTITRAWVAEPDVLLLDEPSSSLDPAATRAVEDLVREVAAGGTRVIMTTHDIGQARRLADDVLFLHRGRLLEHTPAERFFNGPVHPAAARFLQGELID